MRVGVSQHASQQRGRAGNRKESRTDGAVQHGAATVCRGHRRKRTAGRRNGGKRARAGPQKVQVLMLEVLVLLAVSQVPEADQLLRVRQRYRPQ